MSSLESSSSIDRIALIQVIVGTALISFSPVFVKLSSLHPIVQAFYRMVFGGGALLVFALVLRTPFWAGWKPLGLAALGGVFFFADLVFWQHSIERVGPGLATILGNFQVFALSIVGVLFYREPLRIRMVFALPLAMVGLFMVVGVDWSHVSARYHAGVWMGLVAAAFYAGFVLVIRQVRKCNPALRPTANLLMVSTVVLILSGMTGWVRGESFVIPDAENWMWMLLYGIVCQAFAWLLISKGVPKLSVSLTGFLLLLQPSLAFIWDVVIFHRPTPPLQWAGVCLALFAIYLGTTKKKIRNRVSG